MQTIAVALQKGGVGKTSTTLSLGVELARRGRQVLLIDMDAQANLTMAAGVDPLGLAASVYDLLLEPAREAAGVVQSTAYGPDLLPASQALANAELMLASRLGRELVLRKILARLTAHYDLVLVDTPPSLGLLTVNALAAADTVLVPLQTHALAYAALDYLEGAVALVREVNPELRISGVVLTMTQRTSMSQAVEEQARQRYGDLVYQTRVPLATKMSEAPAAGQPIAVYAPESAPAVAYRQLAAEVEARL